MNRCLSIFFTILFSFVSVVLFAQKDKTQKDPTGWKKADKLYQQKGYMSSATKYQMKHDESKMTPEVMARVANSYRLNGEVELAEYWYAKCIPNSKDVKDLLNYAEVLQSTGKCEDAIRWYKEYKKKAPKTKREFISDCTELSAIIEHENMTVENLKALNTKFLDYSAMNHDEGVMFTSTRKVNKMRKMTDTWTKSNFSDVFYAKKDDEGNFEMPIAVKGNINKKYHDGVTSVTKSGTVMYFSRNNSKGKNKNNLIDLKIYSSVYVNGAWKDATELGFNSDDFASCHPSITGDGKWLYFASNRPGGFGGMDIYVSENVDGMWKEPQNLGPTVNSAGNELFPFINEDGALFFASNGHKGMGGLDIFYAEKASTFDEATWNTRKNIGKPFNTKKDDFGFYANGNMTEGFLTSNRPGGKGSDDIYTWTSTDKKPLKLNEAMMASINVVDAVSNNKVGNATVVIEEVSGDGMDFEGDTNAKGMVETSIESGKTYKVTVEKDGYVLTKREMSARELSNLTIDLEKENCKELYGKVLNEKYNKVIASAFVTLINTCTKEETVIRTEADGTFNFCLAGDCEYKILATKNDFIETETVVSTIGNTSDWENKEMKIELLPKETPKVTTTTAVATSESKTKVKKHFLGNETATFRTGQVLTLKNIYYNYNKSNIRPDAQVELDYVVTMMSEFPTMEISLLSHTDSRGKRNYNKKLSDARAQAARQYIISRGIGAHRIVASGLGETSLKNDCVDGVKCSEEKHQINRRTEILINKVD